MVSKINRTIDKYMQVGAEMRLLKTLAARLMIDGNEVIPANEMDKLSRAFSKINHVCSITDDNMFKDFPELSKDFCSVFYGRTNAAPRNDIDHDVLDMAAKTARQLIDREYNEDIA